MINELKLIDNINILYDNKIVLYGAGTRGVETLKKLKETGIPVAYFCDGDHQKCGVLVEGVEVLSLTQLKQLDEYEKLAIIISTDQMHVLDQIVDDIAWLKLRTDNIFTIFGLNLSLERNNITPGMNCAHHDALIAMRKDIFVASRDVDSLEMFARWAEKPNVILVFTYPKTGTYTITKSLYELNIFADSLHWMASHFVTAFLEQHKKEYIKILKSRKLVKIITMIRDPISAKLSLIFQRLTPSKYREYGFVVIPPGTSFAKSVAEVMASRRLAKSDTMCEQFDWFDNELKAISDIDVYANPFDREKGYSIIKRNNVESLVMKLEKLNSMEQVIAEFVGAPRFKLKNDNEGDNKPYKYLYKQIKKAIKIPRETFDFYYKDPRMSHFYSEDEIAGFLNKWKDNIAD